MKTKVGALLLLLAVCAGVLLWRQAIKVTPEKNRQAQWVAAPRIQERHTSAPIRLPYPRTQLVDRKNLLADAEENRANGVEYLRDLKEHGLPDDNVLVVAAQRQVEQYDSTVKYLHGGEQQLKDWCRGHGYDDECMPRTIIPPEGQDQ